MNPLNGSGRFTVFRCLGTEMSGVHQPLLENAFSRIRNHMPRAFPDQYGINPFLYCQNEKRYIYARSNLSLESHVPDECMVSTLLWPHSIVRYFNRR